MTDTRALKQRHDLRVIVEQDLGPPPVRSGRTCSWKCPFHHERRGYSLVVWADGYRCFGKCQESGDLFDWLQRYRKVSFADALAVLGGMPQYEPEITVVRPTPPVDPPAGDWQAKAWQVVEQAEEWLWDAPGADALTYLLETRGLDERTIRGARLGVIPGGYRQWRTIAGLSVPCGITIPWITGNTLWAVKVRRAAGQPKYVQIAGGSSGGLYRGDALTNAQAVLFCEGEFDVLVAHQEAEPLVTAVTLGSASSGLNDRWLLDLVSASLILAAYDVDRAGRKGAARLRQTSNRVHVVRVPYGKDITEFHQQGGDVFTWLSQELRQIREKAGGNL